MKKLLISLTLFISVKSSHNVGPVTSLYLGGSLPSSAGLYKGHGATNKLFNKEQLGAKNILSTTETQAKIVKSYADQMPKIPKTTNQQGPNLSPRSPQKKLGEYGRSGAFIYRPVAAV